MTEKEIEEKMKVLGSLPGWILPSIWAICCLGLVLIVPSEMFDSNWEKYFVIAMGGLFLTGLLLWMIWPRNGSWKDERDGKEKILLLGPQSLDRLLSLEKKLAEASNWQISCRWIFSARIEEAVSKEWNEERVEELSNKGYLFGVVAEEASPRCGLVFWDNFKNKQVVVWHKVVLVEGADRVRWQLGELTEEELLGNFNKLPLNV